MPRVPRPDLERVGQLVGAALVLAATGAVSLVLLAGAVRLALAIVTA